MIVMFWILNDPTRPNTQPLVLLKVNNPDKVKCIINNMYMYTVGADLCSIHTESNSCVCLYPPVFECYYITAMHLCMSNMGSFNKVRSTCIHSCNTRQKNVILS